MKIILTILCLVFISDKLPSEDDHFKDVVKHFYKLLFKESVSIDEFSSVYATASLDYDTGLFLRDSLGIQSYDFELARKRDKSIDVKETSSYVFKKVKLNQEEITFGLSNTQIEKVIDKAEVSTFGWKFSTFLILDFSSTKQLYFALNNDTPKQILAVWLNNSTLLDDVIRGSKNPQRLMLPGTIKDSDGFTNIRKEPNVNSQIIAKFLEGDIFYYIPENDVNWWQVSHVEDSRSIIGFVHKSRIKNYNDMSLELKQKVFEKRNEE